MSVYSIYDDLAQLRDLNQGGSPGRVYDPLKVPVAPIPPEYSDSIREMLRKINEGRNKKASTDRFAGDILMELMYNV